MHPRFGRGNFSPYAAPRPIGRATPRRATLKDALGTGAAQYAGNGNAPGGYVIGQGQESVVRVLGRAHDERDLADITIALRGAGLRKQAVATARRIGPVLVDHGETNCKTPAAIPYIEKTVAHREAQAAKKAAKA